MEFVERFAVPACGLTMSSIKMHEILSLLDRAERMQAGFKRRAAIDHHLKTLRSKKYLTRKEHDRFIALMREHAQISRRLIRLLNAEPKEQ